MIGALISWIVIGLIAGWLAGKIMKGSGYGAIADILLGMVGAVVGGWIVHLLGFYSSGGLIPSILVATLGAIVLIWLSRKIRKR
ncbi:MAG TPA: GlsB/YeaQ/YmgE family stress response membrane protein [Candidatus Angelobacter sp.]|nr:GlsB/YeaQ/YmgE family stress response membrane protein [Candidatus Angelobacter sp.]